MEILIFLIHTVKKKILDFDYSQKEAVYLIKTNIEIYSNFIVRLYPDYPYFGNQQRTKSKFDYLEWKSVDKSKYVIIFIKILEYQLEFYESELNRLNVVQRKLNSLLRELRKSKAKS